MPVFEDPDADLRGLLAEGRKLEAVKRYLERHRVGLAEAKAAVDAMEHTMAAAPRSSGGDDDEVRAALARGDKIEAIRLHRARYRSSLAEAKEAVEAIPRGVAQRTAAWTAGEAPYRAGPRDADPDAAALGEIDALIGQRNLIAAIKRYREHFHVGLREAKEAVEARAGRR